MYCQKYVSSISTSYFFFFFVICTQMMLHFFFFIIQFVLTFIRIRLQPLMTTKTYCILFLYISSSLSFGMRPDMKPYSIIVQMLVYYWFVNNCIAVLAGHEHQKCKPILLLYFYKKSSRGMWKLYSTLRSLVNTINRNNNYNLSNIFCYLLHKWNIVLL